MSTPVHLVRMSIDAQKLHGFARSSRATARAPDAGYATHALLAALFDHGASPESRVAPKPFHVVDPSQRWFDVLGYSSLDHNALRDRAKAFADPLAWGVCDLEKLVSKPMPGAFEAGTRLGFSVRACPVRRIAKRGPMTSARAEVDVFLEQAWAAPDKALNREEIYVDWLKGQLTSGGAVQVHAARVTQLQLGRFLRRTQGDERHGHTSGRPDVTFAGTLEVVDPLAFSHLLARGVGRHRSFGFGMLLLCPPDPR